MAPFLVSLIGQRWRQALEGLLVLSMTVLTVTLTWKLMSVRTVEPNVVRPATTKSSKPAPAPMPKQPVSLDGAILIGNADAKIAVIEYSDVQCPYCGAFARDVFPDFEQQFIETGKVILAFRHFPLEQLHPLAKGGASAIECAAQQNKAWPMHDRLFADQRRLDGKAILATAGSLGPEDKRFASCMSSTKVSAKIAADIATGRVLGVTGTPTFFLGTRQPDGTVRLVERVVGAAPISQWQLLVNKWSAESGSK